MRKIKKLSEMVAFILSFKRLNSLLSTYYFGKLET
nr:MAG TPA: hypothetical protein [Caudoviricetes sp.]